MWFCFNLASDVVLPYFGRNSFWNLYQYFWRNFFCKFNFILLQLCILLFVWEEIYSIMFNNICGENSSESCTWYCYHYIPYFIIWEEIYSEICTNIWEGISSESFTSYSYYHVSYFMIWEEIYSENCTNMWGEYSSERWPGYFNHCVSYFYVWEEIYSENCINILLKVVLYIVTIIYPTSLFGKKFIPKFVPIFGLG